MGLTPESPPNSDSLDIELAANEIARQNLAVFPIAGNVVPAGISAAADMLQISISSIWITKDEVRTRPPTRVRMSQRVPMLKSHSTVYVSKLLTDTHHYGLPGGIRNTARPSISNLANRAATSLICSNSNIS